MLSIVSVVLTFYSIFEMKLKESIFSQVFYYNISISGMALFQEDVKKIAPILTEFIKKLKVRK